MKSEQDEEHAAEEKMDRRMFTFSGRFWHILWKARNLHTTKESVGISCNENF
jgi:hypothetical protein